MHWDKKTSFVIQLKFFSRKNQIGKCLIPVVFFRPTLSLISQLSQEWPIWGVGEPPEKTKIPTAGARWNTKCISPSYTAAYNQALFQRQNFYWRYICCFLEFTGIYRCFSLHLDSLFMGILSWAATDVRKYIIFPRAFRIFAIPALFSHFVLG